MNKLQAKRLISIRRRLSIEIDFISRFCFSLHESFCYSLFEVTTIDMSWSSVARIVGNYRYITQLLMSAKVPFGCLNLIMM